MKRYRNYLLLILISLVTYSCVEDLETTLKDDVKTSFLMNWGWDGESNNTEYAITPTANWKGNRYTFKYNTKIYYNLRVNN